MSKDKRKIDSYLRKLVLERDNYKCKKCGIELDSYLTEIHHKVPYIICKEDKIDNLFSLCFFCHACAPFESDKFDDWLKSEKVSYHDEDDESNSAIRDLVNDLFINKRDKFYDTIFTASRRRNRDHEYVLKYKRDSGLSPVRAPFGYKFSYPRNVPLWIIDKKNSSTVLSVCEDFIRGVYYKDTIARLNISRSLYYRILKNVEKGLYSGYVCYTRKIRDPNKNIIRQEEVKYLGKHQAIISDEIYKEFITIRRILPVQ